MTFYKHVSTCRMFASFSRYKPAFQSLFRLELYFSYKDQPYRLVYVKNYRFSVLMAPCWVLVYINSFEDLSHATHSTL